MKKFGVVAVAVVLNLFVSSSSFSSATEELEGTLEIIMATDISRKTCEAVYFINVSGKRTQFSLPARAPLLLPGQPIKISGRWEEDSGKKNFHCRKVESVATAPVAPKTASMTNDVNDASNYLPKQYPVLGPQNILIVCLNSPDTKDDSPVWTKEKIDDKIFSNKHSLDAYWQACSVDNITGESKVWLTGDILDNGNWKTMPKNWTEYGYGSDYGSDDERKRRREFENDMVALIDPEVDFSKSQYDGIIIFRTGKGWKYDWSSVGKTTISTNEGEVKIATSYLTENDIEIDNDYAAHESGHGLFSLLHAQSISILSGEIHPYGDWWDNRGAQYALLDGLHKYILGWLNISQIVIVNTSGEYWVDQRELASGGIKLLVIALEIPGVYKHDYTYEFRYSVLIYIEYHRGLGEFDSQLSFRNKNEKVDPNNLVLYKKYELIAGYDSLVYVASDDGNDCLDLESEEFCDKEKGVCVQVLEKIEEGPESRAKVKITLTEDYSFPTPIPTPTPTPTPTPCKPEIIRISPENIMNLKRKTSGEATVTVTSANDCAVEGETITAKIFPTRGKKFVSVSPSRMDTNENGQATFTITAGKKTGRAMVSFQAGNFQKFLTVKVKKK